MSLTFAEKVLSAKAGRAVRAGEIVVVEPDAVLSHDNSAAIAQTFADIGVARVRYPERLVIVLDHCVPAADFKHATNHQQIREFVAAQGIANFFDIHHGVCHQVLLEHGFAQPGGLIVGSDSHTTSYGAVGCFAAGIGRTEAACTWASGSLWLRVPETLRIEVSGALRGRVGAKDLVLYVAGQIGADGGDYLSLEWTGPAVQDLSVDSRFVLCNMSAELGAKNGYVPPDEKVAEWLGAVGATHASPAGGTSGPPVVGAEQRSARDQARLDGPSIARPLREERAHGDSASNGRGMPRPYAQWHTDAAATLKGVIDIDAAVLAPQVACPHRVDNVKPITEVLGTRIHQCLVGTCTNGRLEDIAAAWNVLAGHTVHPSTRLLVFPASRQVNLEAVRAGYMERFVEAGAVWMNPGCGPCLGAHEGALAPGEACLSTANRNFRGRMGTPDSAIYLASPQSVAAAAITGEITDPREVR